MWHSGLDPLIPTEHALQLALWLPPCRIFVDPDEGHHFFRRRLEEIMTVVLNPDCGPHALSVAGARAPAAKSGRTTDRPVNNGGTTDRPVNGGDTTHRSPRVTA